MLYRIDLKPEFQDALVQHAPSGTLRALMTHLKQLADAAPGATNSFWSRLRDPESGLIRWERQGFRVLFDIDFHRRCIVVMKAMTVRA